MADIQKTIEIIFGATDQTAPAIKAAKMRIAAEIKGADAAAFHAPAPGTLVN